MTRENIKSTIIEEYWRKKFTEEYQSEILPINRTRDSQLVEKKEKLVFKIHETTIQKLNTMAKGSNLGRFVLYLSAVFGCLYQYSPNKNFIGTTSPRGKDETDNLLFLTNDIRGDETWRDLIEYIKKEVSQTFNHKNTSVTKILKKLNFPSSDKKHNKLWQIACIDETLQVETKELEQFQLVIKFVPENQGYYLHLVYNNAVYNQAIIRSFARNLIFCLDSLQENLEMQLDSEIADTLHPEEKHYLLKEINGSDYNFMSSRTLHQLLEEQVDRTPDKIAIIDSERTITYREINCKANQLAVKLRKLGVGPESIVGILVEPSIDIIIAITAVLKAGGAYCPIDPDFPNDRVQLMCEDCRISLILSLQEYQYSHTFNGKVLNISNPDVFEEESSNISNLVSSNNLAYVIYTSGSTGKPKGVMIEHRNIVNQIYGLKSLYSFEEDLRHILLAPFTFDPSVQQLFLPLTTGGTLYLLPKESKNDPKIFWEIVRKEKINVINTVPSWMEVLLEHAERITHQFEFTILAGEAFTNELARRLSEKLDILRLINIYGPTETTINATIYECGLNEKLAMIPIGKPLPNYRLYVLDNKQRLLPFGVTGELFIAGEGLARGYINNSQKTDEVFLPDPFDSEGSRMYKTGDLVRWLPEGNMEFVGRSDNQVKFRGMRIELNEIALKITEMSFIKEAVVIKHGVQEEVAQLVAFYTLTKVVDDTTNEVETIKVFLRQHLPTYMIPTHFICLKSMPITNNGKIDQKALPFKRISVPSDIYMEPRNEIENKIYEVWKAVLSISRIGVNDSFFEIGGNSLSIIRLQSMINHEFQANITISQLFTYHTIALQATMIQERQENLLSGITNVTSQKESNKNIEKLNGVHDVAVIGMSCKFPLADGYEQFWNNLSEKVDAVREITQQRIRDIGISDLEKPIKPSFFPQGGYLERIDGFDAKFFGISPNEAKMMDPQQRIFLQVVWNAIIDAGYSEKEVANSKTGVYVGAAKPRYMDLIQNSEPSVLPGNLLSVIAGRISYTFNLTGPSEIIDTACSSSLMAVHHAVQGIITGDCDLAIAGGVNIHLSLIDETIFDMGIASPNGRTKAYDSSADGAGGGEGVGAVILKPLEKAIADGDHIYSVIKGTATNSDGRSNGITAPNAASQANVIEQAWNRAGIDPQTITYIETHGTGTKLGDPIEIEGISEAFSRYTEHKQFCAVGSVKTNIGHLDSAAGIAGFIKTVLALYKKQIPATINFKDPNKYINFTKSPLYVNEYLNDWEPDCGVRRAGVSSFGLSGTNCHVVLEEYSNAVEEDPKQKDQIFTLSAKSEKALRDYAERFSNFLLNTEFGFEDICYCSNISRGQYTYRLAIVANCKGDLQKRLSLFAQDKLINLEENNIYSSGPGQENKSINKVEFGQQIASVIETFLRGNEPNWLTYYSGENRYRVPLPSYPYEEVRYWVVPKQGEKISSNIKSDEINNEYVWSQLESVFNSGEFLLNQSGFSNPVGYKEAIEDFAAHLLMNFIQSYGTLNEQFKSYDREVLKSAISIVPQYERLFEFILKFLVEKGNLFEIDGQIIISETYYIVDSLSLLERYCNMYPEFSGTFKALMYCLDSYPDVLSGKVSPLSVLFPKGEMEFLTSFSNKGKTWGDLYQIIGIDAIKQYLTSQKGKPLKILEVGAGSGTVGKVIFPIIENQEVEYYYTDIGRSVLMESQKRFNKYSFIKYKIYNIENDPYEQGFQPDEFDVIIALNVVHATKSLQSSLSNLKKVLAPNGTLFLIEKVQSEITENLVWGMTEGWWLYEDQDLRKHTPLVTTSIWEQVLRDSQFEEVKSFPRSEHKDVETALIVGRNGSHKTNSAENLLYGVQWVEKELKITGDNPKGTWLLFEDTLGISIELTRRLTLSGQSIITVGIGNEYCKLNDNHYLLNPNNDLEYHYLLDNIKRGNTKLDGVIHLWSCIETKEKREVETSRDFLDLGVYSLYFLTKALLKSEQKEVIDIRVVSNLAVKVSNEEIITPLKAPVYGLAKVISQEHPNLQCFALDVNTNNHTPKGIATIIIDELKENKSDSLVAIRENRLVQEMTRLKLNSQPHQEIALRKNGLYIVVGGAGGLGLEMCKYLSREKSARVVIINRTLLPEKSLWSKWIGTQKDKNIKEYRIVSELLEMQRYGLEIHYYNADVANEHQMENVINEIRDKFGKIHGVFHCASASSETSKPIEKQTLDGFMEVLRPKIDGTMVLDTIFKDDPLDFLILYSSVSSLWGGFGGGDYAAANIFMDSFSAYRNQSGKNTLAINWYAWEGLTGPGCMAYMTVNEALEAFTLCLSRCMDQVIIGKFDVQKLIEWAPMMKIQLASNVTKIPEFHIPLSILDGVEVKQKILVDVTLLGKDEGNYSNLEKQIAQIWSEVLGYEEIDVYANFFEIGGDSLLILKILKLLHERVDSTLETADLFSYSSVFHLAEFIESKNKPNAENLRQIDKLRNKTDHMKDDNLRNLLKQVKEEVISVDEAMKGYGEI